MFLHNSIPIIVHQKSFLFYNETPNKTILSNFGQIWNSDGVAKNVLSLPLSLSLSHTHTHTYTHTLHRAVSNDTKNMKPICKKDFKGTITKFDLLDCKHWCPLISKLCNKASSHKYLCSPLNLQLANAPTNWSTTVLTVGKGRFSCLPFRVKASTICHYSWSIICAGHDTYVVLY